MISGTNGSEICRQLNPKIIDIKKTSVLQSNSAVTGIIAIIFMISPERQWLLPR